MKSIAFLNIIVALLLSLNVHAQSNQDFGIWTDLELDKELSESLSLTAATSFRTNNNSTRLGQVFLQGGLEYSFLEYFKTSLNYRHRLQMDYGDNEITSRFIWDITAKEKFGDIAFQFRNRLQQTFGEGRDPILERTRLKTEFDLQKGLDGYFFGELFFDLNHDRNEVFTMYRYGLGMQQKINDYLKITVGFMRQHERFGRYPDVDNVLQIEASFSI